jgi:threonine/homoserine efflux transporter RhtA
MKWIFTPRINLVDLVGMFGVSYLMTNYGFYWGLAIIPLVLVSAWGERHL